MAHYALINENNTVTSVIVGGDELDVSVDWEQLYSNTYSYSCKRTSYNTNNGIHSFDKTPFRKNFAGIGYTYDSVREAFIMPKPFNSWILNEDTCWWEAPVNRPTKVKNANGNLISYSWNEENQKWDIIS